jgi:oxygen-dependent protoporphyrinogen oxidase
MELAQGFSHLMSSLGDKVRVNWKLTTIQKAGGGGYTLTYETPEGTITVGTKALVLTVPSYVASDILQPLSVQI